MKIKLINMPFADIAIPSIALTQIRSVTESVFGERVKTDIYYLNHDLCNYLSIEVYNYISLSMNSNNSGFGDWFFRQQAFPEQMDNLNGYINRYAHVLGFDFLKKHGPILQYKREKLGMFLDELIAHYQLADSDIVGFTSMFMQNLPNLALAKKIKEKNQDIVVVMGGANCEAPMGEEIVKSFDAIDYVFSGASLISFPKFVDRIVSGNRKEIETINGIFSKNKCRNEMRYGANLPINENKGIEVSRPIGDEMSMDEFIALNYDSFLESFDNFFPNTTIWPYLLFQTSRGCWWGSKLPCAFCGLNSNKLAYCAMENERAVVIIDDLIDRYGDRVNFFMSVDSILPKEYIKDVFPHINNKSNAVIFYELKADLTYEEMKILSTSGVVQVQPGIEALSTATLKLMRKGTTAFNNLHFLMNCVRCSIMPNWNLLIGFPGEEESVYEKYYRIIPSLHHLPPPQGVFPVRFDRYSTYFEKAHKYKLKLDPLDYYGYIYPFKKETIQKISYYFKDNNYGAEYIRITGKWINKLTKKVEEWRGKWERITETDFPKLFFLEENGAQVVLDKRDEHGIKIDLDLIEATILKMLDRKKSISWLQTQLKNYTLKQLKSILDRLEHLGLLFEETGKYLSLVFCSETKLKRWTSDNECRLGVFTQNRKISHKTLQTLII